MRTLLLLCAVSVVAGCVHMNATQDQLLSRASFDLQCERGQLEIVRIDDRTRGVRGCGEQVTYVESCKPCANGYQGCECTWLLNTDGRNQQSGAQASGGR